VFFEEAVSSSH